MVGTKSLQSIVKAVQGRGCSIQTAVDMYNKLLDDLLALDCPTWVAKEQLPKRLDRKAIIAIDPDAPLWEEMSLGNVWAALWGSDFASAPAYVCDPNVRKGINMMLQLDRIEEEEQQLCLERNNMCDEFLHMFRLICLALQKYDGEFLMTINI
jgi:hypothetical protein